MNRKLILSMLIVVFIVVAVAGIFMFKNYTDRIKTPKPSSAAFTAKEELEETIKQTFKDPKDQDIIQYMRFASTDRTLKAKYIDYSKAYQLIYQRHATPSANVTTKLALIKLRTFLRPFPQYKESDFKLPE